MKAVIYESYGGPEVLELTEKPMPEPKADEIRVRVKATSVSSADSRMRRADPYIVRLFNGFKTPRQQILGAELSGIVDAVGDNVSRFKVGDKVFAGTGASMGGSAEYICLSQDSAVALMPDNISFEEAASIPFGATASLYFLKHRVNLQAGQRILINGASGALGVYAIQLAKYFGAHVTAVCSQRHADKLRALGADEVVDYTQQPVASLEQSFDVIYDTVGKISFNESKHLLTPNGKFVEAVAFLRELIQMLCLPLWSKNRIIAGIAIEKREDMEFLKSLIEKGAIKAVIDKTYPMQDISDAHAYVDQGHKLGAVVITVA